jgi:hypothetical protein
MREPWRVLVVAALCLAASDRPAAAGPERLRIDARSGGGRATVSFPTRTVITVELFNKNPFLYRYRVTANEAAVEEPAVEAFLAYLSPVFPGGAKRATAERIRMPANLPPECGAAAAVTALGQRVAALNHRIPLVEEVIDTHAQVRAVYVDRRATLTHPWAEQSRLQDAAEGLITALEGYLNPSDGSGGGKAAVEDAFQELALAGADAAAVATAAKEAAAKVSGCGPLTEVEAQAKDVRERSVPQWKAALTSAQRDIATFETALRDTKRTQGDANAYSQVYELCAYRHPANLVITVERWVLDDQDEKRKETVAKTTVMLGGGQRFFLSGGVAYVHGVATREYRPARGYALDAHGTATDPTTMATIVGIQQESPDTLTPVALLNGRLVSDLLWTIGTTARKDAAGMHLDYLAGLSWAVFDRRLFLTAAWYYGRETSLAGDLYVGATIPDDMTAIPTRTTYRSGASVVLTYRIK